MGGKVQTNKLSERSKELHQTTLYLDQERYRKIKIIAAIESKSATDMIHEAFDMLIATRQPLIRKVSVNTPAQFISK